MALPRVGRAHALDAEALDSELEGSLLAQLGGALSIAAGPAASQSLQPELTAALRALVWWLTHGQGGSTAGQALHNLRCCERGAPPHPTVIRSAPPRCAPPPIGSFRRGAHALLVVLVPWVWERASRAIARREGPRATQLLRLMRRVEAAVAFASLAVSFRFLVEGRSPSLAMAVLGLELRYAEPGKPRRAAAELVEQQLAWRALADLIGSLRQLWHTAPRQGVVEEWMGWQAFSRWILGTRSEAGGARSGCVHCGADPPHTRQLSACGHQFCYFCLASLRMSSARARCPVCAARLHNAEECSLVQRHSRDHR